MSKIAVSEKNVHLFFFSVEKGMKQALPWKKVIACGLVLTMTCDTDRVPWALLLQLVWSLNLQVVSHGWMLLTL